MPVHQAQRGILFFLAVDWGKRTFLIFQAAFVTFQQQTDEELR
jgi:hypothetical protein